MQKQLLLSAAMALSLIACGNTESAEPVNQAADQHGESLSKDANAPSANLALTNEFMTGKWALESDGDCTLAQNFKADGSVDGFFQKWFEHMLLGKIIEDGKAGFRIGGDVLASPPVPL